MENETCPKCRTTDFKSCHSIRCPMREDGNLHLLESDKKLTELFLNTKPLSDSIFKYRRTGRTTKLVDMCIQEFFTEGKTHCIDHYPSDEDCKILLNLVLDRLSREHNITEKDITINKYKFTITKK